MRRAIFPTLLAVMFVALVAPTAAADKPETRAVIPIGSVFGPVVNPCTGQETMLETTGVLELHALPSIEGFFSGEFKHADLRITGQIVGLDDGYATEWKRFWTEVFNINGEHYVETRAQNLMFHGDDGGKYRIHRPLKLVIVRGEVKVSMEFDDTVCVRQPTG